ncbi:MAG: alpha/beta fold hydrolase [Pseudomonadales bacterium]
MGFIKRGKIVLMAVLGALALGGLWLFEGDIPAAEIDPLYSSSASQFLPRSDGSRIHFRDEGLRDGPAIVLVHGSNASLHTWEPWVARLGDDWRVVTLDLPGHGLTGRVPDDDYSMVAFIETVGAVVDHLGIETFVLGGNSMGGGVTWQYALAHPERVRAMVLVDAVGLWSWREQQGPPRGEGSPLAFRLLGQSWFRGIARSIDPKPLIRQGLEASFFDPEKVDDAMVQRYYDLALRSGSREATLARFEGFGQARQTPEPDLSTLTQPTLVMWGEHDRLIPVAIGQRFVAVLPRARLVVYPDAGHIPMEEVPDRSASDLRAFLEEALPASESGA